MSLAQIAAAARAVFPDITVSSPIGRYPLRVLMVAIAGHESSWEPGAHGDCLGGPGHYNGPPACQNCASWGAWQVNLPTWGPLLTHLTGSTNPCTWAQWLTDPTHAATAAWAIYQADEASFGAGQGFQAWQPDFSGGVQAHLAAAAAALGASATIPTAPPASHQSSGQSPGPTPQLVFATGFGLALAVALVIGGLAYLARG